MIDYDFYLVSSPGGPEYRDLFGQSEDEQDYLIEEIRRAFRRLSPREVALRRRAGKKSIRRRLNNVEWYIRQRRLDRNAQVIF